MASSNIYLDGISWRMIHRYRTTEHSLHYQNEWEKAFFSLLQNNKCQSYHCWYALIHSGNVEPLSRCRANPEEFFSSQHKTNQNLSYRARCGLPCIKASDQFVIATSTVMNRHFVEKIRKKHEVVTGNCKSCQPWWYENSLDTSEKWRMCMAHCLLSFITYNNQRISKRYFILRSRYCPKITPIVWVRNIDESRLFSLLFSNVFCRI